MEAGRFPCDPRQPCTLGILAPTCVWAVMRRKRAAAAGALTQALVDVRAAWRASPFMPPNQPPAASVLPRRFFHLSPRKSLEPITRRRPEALAAAKEAAAGFLAGDGPSLQSTVSVFHGIIFPTTPVFGTSSPWNDGQLTVPACQLKTPTSGGVLW